MVRIDENVDREPVFSVVIFLKYKQMSLVMIRVLLLSYRNIHDFT